VRLCSFDSIQALLSAPNPDDPLAENIAKHWKTNEAEAVETGECIPSHNTAEDLASLGHDFPAICVHSLS
jgi:hypothetical protein